MEPMNANSNIISGAHQDNPALVQNIVSQLKSQGLFDEFRKECISDIDTKPVYQNLLQRVNTYVRSYLSKQRWSSDLNKNRMREKIKNYVSDCPFLEPGIERVVNQVVDPKIRPCLVPKVEEAVHKYVGYTKPDDDDYQEDVAVSDFRQSPFPNDHLFSGGGSTSATIESGFNNKSEFDENIKDELETDFAMSSNFLISNGDDNEKAGSEDDDISPPFEPHDVGFPGVSYSDSFKDRFDNNYSAGSKDEYSGQIINKSSNSAESERIRKFSSKTSIKHDSSSDTSKAESCRSEKSKDHLSKHSSRNKREHSSNHSSSRRHHKHDVKEKSYDESNKEKKDGSHKDYKSQSSKHRHHYDDKEKHGPEKRHKSSHYRSDRDSRHKSSGKRRSKSPSGSHDKKKTESVDEMENEDKDVQNLKDKGYSDGEKREKHKEKDKQKQRKLDNSKDRCKTDKCDKNNRRSPDRDGNNSSSSFSYSTSNTVTNSEKDASNNSSVDNTRKNSSSFRNGTTNSNFNREIPIRKPKIASNMFEIQKIMKLRKAYNRFYGSDTSKMVGNDNDNNVDIKNGNLRNISKNDIKDSGLVSDKVENGLESIKSKSERSDNSEDSESEETDSSSTDSESDDCKAEILYESKNAGKNNSTSDLFKNLPIVVLHDIFRDKCDLTYKIKESDISNLKMTISEKGFECTSNEEILDSALDIFKIPPSEISIASCAKKTSEDIHSSISTNSMVSKISPVKVEKTNYDLYLNESLNVSIAKVDDYFNNKIYNIGEYTKSTTPGKSEISDIKEFYGNNGDASGNYNLRKKGPNKIIKNMLSTFHNRRPKFFKTKDKFENSKFTNGKDKEENICKSKKNTLLKKDDENNETDGKNDAVIVEKKSIKTEGLENFVYDYELKGDNHELVPQKIDNHELVPQKMAIAFKRYTNPKNFKESNKKVRTKEAHQNETANTPDFSGQENNFEHISNSLISKTSKPDDYSPQKELGEINSSTVNNAKSLNDERDKGAYSALRIDYMKRLCHTRFSSSDALNNPLFNQLNDIIGYDTSCTLNFCSKDNSSSKFDNSVPEIIKSSPVSNDYKKLNNVSNGTENLQNVEKCEQNISKHPNENGQINEEIGDSSEEIDSIKTLELLKEEKSSQNYTESDFNKDSRSVIDQVREIQDKSIGFEIKSVAMEDQNKNVQNSLLYNNLDEARNELIQGPFQNDSSILVRNNKESEFENLKNRCIMQSDSKIKNEEGNLLKTSEDGNKIIKINEANDQFGKSNSTKYNTSAVSDGKHRNDEKIDFNVFDRNVMEIFESIEKKQFSDAIPSFSKSLKDQGNQNNVGTNELENKDSKIKETGSSEIKKLRNFKTSNGKFQTNAQIEMNFSNPIKVKKGLLSEAKCNAPSLDSKILKKVHEKHVQGNAKISHSDLEMHSINAGSKMIPKKTSLGVIKIIKLHGQIKKSPLKFHNTDSSKSIRKVEEKHFPVKLQDDVYMTKNISKKILNCDTTINMKSKKSVKFMNDVRKQSDFSGKIKEYSFKPDDDLCPKVPAEKKELLSNLEMDTNNSDAVMKGFDSVSLHKSERIKKTPSRLMNCIIPKKRRRGGCAKQIDHQSVINENLENDKILNVLRRNESKEVDPSPTTEEGSFRIDEEKELSCKLLECDIPKATYIKNAEADLLEFVDKYELKDDHLENFLNVMGESSKNTDCELECKENVIRAPDENSENKVKNLEPVSDLVRENSFHELAPLKKSGRIVRKSSKLENCIVPPIYKRSKKTNKKFYENNSKMFEKTDRLCAEKIQSVLSTKSDMDDLNQSANYLKSSEVSNESLEFIKKVSETEFKNNFEEDVSHSNTENLEFNSKMGNLNSSSESVGNLNSSTQSVGNLNSSSESVVSPLLKSERIRSKPSKLNNYLVPMSKKKTRNKYVKINFNNYQARNTKKNRIKALRSKINQNKQKDSEVIRTDENLGNITANDSLINLDQNSELIAPLECSKSNPINLENHEKEFLEFDSVKNLGIGDFDESKNSNPENIDVNESKNCNLGIAIDESNSSLVNDDLVKSEKCSKLQTNVMKSSGEFSGIEKIVEVNKKELTSPKKSERVKRKSFLLDNCIVPTVSKKSRARRNKLSKLSDSEINNTLAIIMNSNSELLTNNIKREPKMTSELDISSNLNKKNYINLSNHTENFEKCDVPDNVVFTENPKQLRLPERTKRKPLRLNNYVFTKLKRLGKSRSATGNNFYDVEKNVGTESSVEGASLKCSKFENNNYESINDQNLSLNFKTDQTSEDSMEISGYGKDFYGFEDEFDQLILMKLKSLLEIKKSNLEEREKSQKELNMNAENPIEQKPNNEDITKLKTYNKNINVQMNKSKFILGKNYFTPNFSVFKTNKTNIFNARGARCCKPNRKIPLKKLNLLRFKNDASKSVVSNKLEISDECKEHEKMVVLESDQNLPEPSRNCLNSNDKKCVDDEVIDLESIEDNLEFCHIQKVPKIYGKNEDDKLISKDSEKSKLLPLLSNSEIQKLNSKNINHMDKPNTDVRIEIKSNSDKQHNVIDPKISEIITDSSGPKINLNNEECIKNQKIVLKRNEKELLVSDDNILARNGNKLISKISDNHHQSEFKDSEANEEKPAQQLSKNIMLDTNLKSEDENVIESDVSKAFKPVDATHHEQDENAEENCTNSIKRPKFKLKRSWNFKKDFEKISERRTVQNEVSTKIDKNVLECSRVDFSGLSKTSNKIEQTYSTFTENETFENLIVDQETKTSTESSRGDFSNTNKKCDEIEEQIDSKISENEKSSADSSNHTDIELKFGKLIEPETETFVKSSEDDSLKLNRNSGKIDEYQMMDSIVIHQMLGSTVTNHPVDPEPQISMKSTEDPPKLNDKSDTIDEHKKMDFKVSDNDKNSTNTWSFRFKNDYKYFEQKFENPVVDQEPKTSIKSSEDLLKLNESPDTIEKHKKMDLKVCENKESLTCTSSPKINNIHTCFEPKFEKLADPEPKIFLESSDDLSELIKKSDTIEENQKMDISENEEISTDSSSPKMKLEPKFFEKLVGSETRTSLESSEDHSLVNKKSKREESLTKSSSPKMKSDHTESVESLIEGSSPKMKIDRTDFFSKLKMRVDVSENKTSPKKSVKCDENHAKRRIKVTEKIKTDIGHKPKNYDNLFEPPDLMIQKSIDLKGKQHNEDKHLHKNEKKLLDSDKSILSKNSSEIKKPRDSDNDAKELNIKRSENLENHPLYLKNDKRMCNEELENEKNKKLFKLDNSNSAQNKTNNNIFEKYCKHLHKTDVKSPEKSSITKSNKMHYDKDLKDDKFIIDSTLKKSSYRVKITSKEDLPIFGKQQKNIKNVKKLIDDGNKFPNKIYIKNVNSESGKSISDHEKHLKSFRSKISEMSTKLPDDLRLKKNKSLNMVSKNEPSVPENHFKSSQKTSIKLSELDLSVKDAEKKKMNIQNSERDKKIKKSPILGTDDKKCINDSESHLKNQSERKFEKFINDVPKTAKIVSKPIPDLSIKIADKSMNVTDGADLNLRNEKRIFNLKKDSEILKKESLKSAENDLASVPTANRNTDDKMDVKENMKFFRSLNLESQKIIKNKEDKKQFGGHEKCSTKTDRKRSLDNSDVYKKQNTSDLDSKTEKNIFHTNSKNIPKKLCVDHNADPTVVKFSSKLMNQDAFIKNRNILESSGKLDRLNLDSNSNLNKYNICKNIFTDSSKTLKRLSPEIDVGILNNSEKRRKSDDVTDLTENDRFEKPINFMHHYQERIFTPEIITDVMKCDIKNKLQCNKIYNNYLSKQCDQKLVIPPEIKTPKLFALDGNSSDSTSYDLFKNTDYSKIRQVSERKIQKKKSSSLKDISYSKFIKGLNNSSQIRKQKLSLHSPSKLKLDNKKMQDSGAPVITVSKFGCSDVKEIKVSEFAISGSEIKKSEVENLCTAIIKEESNQCISIDSLKENVNSENARHVGVNPDIKVCNDQKIGIHMHRSKSLQSIKGERRNTNRKEQMKIPERKNINDFLVKLSSKGSSPKKLKLENKQKSKHDLIINIFNLTQSSRSFDESVDDQVQLNNPIPHNCGSKTFETHVKSKSENYIAEC